MNLCPNLRSRNSLLKWPKLSQKNNYLFFGFLGGFAPKNTIFPRKCQNGGSKNPSFGQKSSQQKKIIICFFAFCLLAIFDFVMGFFPFFSCFVPFSSNNLSSSYWISLSLSLYFCLSFLSSLSSSFFLSLSHYLSSSFLSHSLSFCFSLHLLHSSFLSLPSLLVFPTPPMFDKSFACRNPIPGPEAWQLLEGMSLRPEQA